MSQQAKNKLTDLKVDETSLVDRPANRREFLVKKREAGDAITINPILAADQELVALDKKDAEGVVADVVAPEVETPAVVETPSAPVVVETPAVPAVVDVPVVPVAADAPVVPVAVEAPATPEAPVAKEEIKIVVEAPKPEPTKVTPRIRAAALAGLNEIVDRVATAKKRLEETVSDPEGGTWIPWEVMSQFAQVNALIDQLNYIGGSEWEAAATIAAGALSVDKVSKAKAGAVVASAQRCHKALGDMLAELAPKASASEAPAVTPPAPVVKSDAPPAPTVATPLADIELQKTVAELKLTVARQAALINKAIAPTQSNAIPVDSSARSNATMESVVVWEPDMAPSRRGRPERF